MSWVTRILPEYLSAGGALLKRDESIPIDSLGPKILTRDETIRVESKTILRRDESIPIDVRGTITLTRNESIPIDAFSPEKQVTRDDRIPIDSTGVNPNHLLLIWSVRNQLNQPFQLTWTVIAASLNKSLTLQWNVRAVPISFSLRWNVVPDLITPLIGTPTPVSIPGGGGPTFNSGDIQLPIGIITKTP